ncbi:hypothetical protein [Fibrobacter sp. UWH1]|uniref:hypothetical protein n=1 Tax=Fibrobacter sp. UWH1 TaxID=1964354 RepID=UPI001595CD9F|nr:hypothetical protein [Fibrobacter sp. UWH1]
MPIVIFDEYGILTFDFLDIDLGLGTVRNGIQCEEIFVVIDGSVILEGKTIISRAVIASEP